MLRKFFYFAALLAFVASAYTIIDFFQYKNERNRLIKGIGVETTRQLRDQVDSLLNSIVIEGKRLAESFGSNDFTEQEIEDIIKKSALSISEIQGVTACFEPFAFSAEKRLHCPYYNKGTKDYLYVEKTYDYTVVGEGTAWYTGIRDEGAKWVEPYYARAAKDWYIDYGIPFYYNNGPKKGKVRGTITMSFVASGFKKIVQNLSLGKTGYGVITSNAGIFLSHPVNEYVGTKNLREVIEETTQSEIVDGFNRMLLAETGNVNYFDPERKDETLFYFDKIPTSGWGMGVMFYKNDLLDDELKLFRKYIQISVSLSLFIFFIIAIYFNKDHLDRGEIWQLSIFSTILLIANIFLVGYLKHKTAKDVQNEASPPIVDIFSLNSFVNQQHVRADELRVPHPINVPTGLFIQRLEFEDSYNLNIGGTLWQKYPLEIVDSVKVGFTFPQMSPFAEASYIEESYRKEIAAKEDDPGHLLVGWDFRVTLRLNLQYSDYPFDKRKLNIEIAPLSKDDHLLFTPDLASYTFTNPSKKSGLSPSISMSGNKIVESYFNYSIDTYESDFGYDDKSLFSEVPMLHYNVHLKRILLNAFVTYLIPIFVCLIMMFILVLACSKTNERQGIIESMAAFFFVLVFSHIDLRKEVITADLMFMEYFYFITYFMVIISTFNLITYAKDKSKVFDFNENQIFKATYFPLFFLLLMIVSLIKFY